MPFSQDAGDKRPPLDLDGIETDEEAVLHLPPSRVARKTYDACRMFGAAPSVALSETLDLWREFQEDARPHGYGQCKTFCC